MPWCEANRIKHDVIRARYSSDMSEADFTLIKPLLPQPKRRGKVFRRWRFYQATARGVQSKPYRGHDRQALR